MRNRKKRTPKSAFHKNLEKATKQSIDAMLLLDSEKHVRLLQDPATGLYVVFQGRINQVYYCPVYADAERYFKKLVSIS